MIFAWCLWSLQCFCDGLRCAQQSLLLCFPRGLALRPISQFSLHVGLVTRNTGMLGADQLDSRLGPLSDIGDWFAGKVEVT